jgi:hypothetical protein
LITFIAYMLSDPSVLQKFHRFLTDPSLAPWFIAFNIHCSFHCFLIDRSFDLSLIHPWSIAWPSNHFSLIHRFLIRILFPDPSLAADLLYYYFNCFLIFQSFNSFIAYSLIHHPDPSLFDYFLIDPSIAFWSINCI